MPLIQEEVVTLLGSFNYSRAIGLLARNLRQ